MKILIYGINYAPECIGIGKYTTEMAEWLAKKGNDVRVITAPPYYPYWQIVEGYSATYRRERLRGVDVWRCPLYVPSKPTGLKRLIHLLSFAILSVPSLIPQIFWKPDVVMVIAPTILCAPSGLFLALLTRARSWLHIQDFESDLASQLGYFSSLGFVKGAERWVMAKFDRTSSISGKMVNRLLEKGIAAGRAVVFPDWVDTADVQADQDGGNLFRQKMGLKTEDFVVLYSGNMGRKQGLEIVLEVADSLRDVPGLVFVLAGEGAARDDIEREALRLNLSNVKLMPLVPSEELVDLLSSANLHLVVQKRGAADFVLPSKLITILSIGGTAILTADPSTELGQVVLQNPGIAILVDPENPKALTEAVRLAKMNKDLLRRFNPIAREYAERVLDKRSILNQFDSVLAALVAS
jgi:colanic acid biosynthesis glycosyl transferase WcaI